MTELCAIIRGRVQGVGYRAFVRATAAELGIEAQAVNNPDGTVIVTATGEREELDALLDKLRVGPRHANVERVENVWRE